MSALLSSFASATGIDINYNLSESSKIDMSDDEISILDSTDDDLDSEQSNLDRQQATLQTYLDSLPYECETQEEMYAKLEEIVGKLIICAETKNWLALTTWDGMLQCWLLMRYTIPKSTRAKMVKLYYELCLIPGLEPRITRSWADMLSRLISNKPGSKRKLETTDLQLMWQPLWRALQKELWPKKRLHDSSRNVVNILLYVAEQSRRYYPVADISNMLSIFFPLVTKDSILTMIPVITSFVPLTHTHLYLPALFKIWEAFNSSVIDDRMIDFAGDISEENMFNESGEEGGAEWKDVGIWTNEQWTILIGKGLGSMNVPVGASRGSSSTSGHADSMADRTSLRIKKSISRQHAIAKTLIYSMAVDGPVRQDAAPTPRSREGHFEAQQTGYLAGSKALDSLDRLVTSTESFFHPSNFGQWTQNLTNFIQRLTSEFSRRWNEERQPACKTPAARRLNPAIRRAFVKTLRTPALLAMFSKDPLSMAYAQAALRNLTMLDPPLVMPELLERAYGGLEVVNETHRTVAVLSMLSAIPLPIVSEKVWLGGQKHLVPLLELCIPGIDLNDPIKTVCATMFITASIQHLKIGDLSTHQSGFSLSSDAPAEEVMDMSDDHEEIPSGVEVNNLPVYSRDEERSLVRDSTASFADWVTSLFRRILALYENLPEEGGKKGTTGGKQEEAVLKSIKSMIDVICMHLSDELFDLVLKLVYDYATTNAKSNAVRAFGQLVACLSRNRPEQTIAKFLPYCTMQIREELKHGASSIRTTSTHVAVPSDTTLHWNMSILRGCLGYGGSALLKHKGQILDILALLIDKTKSERGYTGTGRLITRILHTVGGVYPLNSRFVNTEEWDDPEFARDHNTQWGRLYEAQDVEIEWHVPSSDEISFILDILNQLSGTALDKVEALLSVEKWDNIARNDFCRYLHVCKSVWSGLPTLYQEHNKEVANHCLNDEYEASGLLVAHIDVKAGFTLADVKDPRYQAALKHRTRYGNVIHRAATILRHGTEGEDHIDAVMAVAKAIDIYLLEYGMSRGNFDSLQKNYARARDLNRVWSKQKENTRLVFVKRAQLYHSSRIYMHALYRRRSSIDDLLLRDLVELCLSPYTRVRRHAQSVYHNACGYYVRSTRLTIPTIFEALAKGTEPDRMKGALYVLWNKGTAAYALADQVFHGHYLLSLLESQHEEKPSIQKLVGNLASDCLVHLTEEAVHSDAYTQATLGVGQALLELQAEFTPSAVDQELLAEVKRKAPVRVAKRREEYEKTISSILGIALRPTTHWRYVQMATRFLHGLLRRDIPPSPQVARFFMEHTISPQPTIRVYAQRAIVKLVAFIKIRTYAKSDDELWLDEWKNPLQSYLPVSAEVVRDIQRSVEGRIQGPFVDKLPTGFLTWTASLKCYAPVQQNASPIAWEKESMSSLKAISDILGTEYYSKLGLLWGQESNKSGESTQLRSENVTFIKSIAKMFENEKLDELLLVIDPLLWESDRFKQRGAAEFLAGLLRGSKHWPKRFSEKLWSWSISRLDRIFAQIKPDTLVFWESAFSSQLVDLDPRRNQRLVDWILALPLEFHGDSAFAMTKSLAIFGVLVDALGSRMNSMSDKYANLLFDNANTGYAEIRGHISQNLYMLTSSRWQPTYPSTNAFLVACQDTNDPLHIREALYGGRISEIQQQLPKWREERLAPPRVSQSEYDKIGLTLLQWIWVSSHGSQASLIIPYLVPMLPDIFKMSELNDSSELQTYSSAVLYILSAVSVAPEFVDVILQSFVAAIKSSTSWRIRLHALPALVVFFYRNLMAITPSGVSKVMDVLLDCLSDENVEVREMSSKALSGVVRCSQRQSIVPLKNRFMSLARKTKLPPRTANNYAESLRALHSAILGLCALIECFPYSVEPWMPPLTEVLAPHATDPPPISTTIRKCASEFKKTHQDTWQKDQQAFDEDQLQSLSTMLVGTSYYA